MSDEGRSGPPTAPPKKRRGLLVGAAVAVFLLCGIGGCAAVLLGIGLTASNSGSQPGAEPAQTLKPNDDLATQRQAWTSQLQDARKLVDAKKYAEAYDAYFAVLDAAKDDTRTADAALIGVALTFNQQMGPSRLSKQLDQALVLQERIPAGLKAEALDGYVRDDLVEPVVTEADDGKQYLDDRRQFIKAIRTDGKGQVYFVPKKDRLLTEAEVVDAQGHLAALGVPGDVVRLYQLARPLAAAMDRFFADDSRYLGEKTVTRNDINQLDSSCNALDKALVPVQRQLDRVDPSWR